MIQQLCAKTLYGWMGFRLNITENHPDKYIICLAPHTSNMDFFVGVLYKNAENIDCKFMMKKEWFFWPLGPIMKALGGIPVYRNKKMHATEIIAQQAMKADKFQLCITPEGTRKNNPEWKKGFYYIAQNASLPILLYGLDYKKRVIECTKTFYPTGDIDKDMAEIKAYFKDYKGRHEEKFAI